MPSEMLLRRFGRRNAPLPRPNERERLATYPPPYPSAWYRLCDAKELRAGRARYFEVAGRKVVLYRGVGGKLGLLDAHCPHLGANLAGGTVVGDCIECPFHKWTFRGNGQLEHIPYARRIPPSIRARAWPVRQWHDMVLGWFPAERDGSLQHIEPDYELEPFEGIVRGDLVYRGVHDGGSVRMHLIEFAENSADIRHFAPLHGSMFVPWTRFRVPGFRVRHHASWEADQRLPHVAYFHDRADLEVLGRLVPRSGADATITFLGPGSLVAFRFHSPEVGSLIMFMTHTPVAPLEQRVWFRWYAQPHIPRALVSYVVGNWVSQWREDISIWENKIYREKPMLVSEDGPIHPMRRWFRQFYETKSRLHHSSQ